MACDLNDVTCLSFANIVEWTAGLSTANCYMRATDGAIPPGGQPFCPGRVSVTLDCQRAAMRADSVLHGAGIANVDVGKLLLEDVSAVEQRPLGRGRQRKFVGREIA